MAAITITYNIPDAVAAETRAAVAAQYGVPATAAGMRAAIRDRFLRPALFQYRRQQLVLQDDERDPALGDLAQS